MKKKKDAKKKQKMPEFEFKEFTAEEGKIYEEAIAKYREAIAAGKALRQAYQSYTVADPELEKLIHADFLKIIIAERHFGQQQPLEQIARELDIPVALAKETQARMLQEVGISAANQFGQEFGSLAPKTDD